MNSTSVIKWVTSRPIGEYRYIMGQIRKAWRTKNGKPVRRLRIKMNATDLHWSDGVRQRDRFQCQICFAGRLTGTRTEAAHVVPRRYKVTRIMHDNGVSLCFSHHRWAHREETRFLRWWAEQYPERLKVLRELVPAWKGWTKL